MSSLQIEAKTMFPIKVWIQIAVISDTIKCYRESGMRLFLQI